MTKIAISQPRYLPAINYLQRAVIADVFVLLDDVQHQRRSFEHRNRVRDSRGEHWLSIPIDRSATSRPKILEMKVSDASWVEEHLRCLRAYYASAPHFDPAALEGLYGGVAGLTSFVEIAEKQLLWTLDFLGFDRRGTIVRSSSCGIDGTGAGHLAALTEKLGGSAYISGPNGRNYIDPAVFGGVEVLYHDFEFPAYPQIGEPFLPWLAWVDCLFHVGRDETRRWIAQEPRLSVR